MELRDLLGEIQIVTTETVLVELLNYFAESGKHARTAALEMVQTIIDDDEVMFIPHEIGTFSKARDLYSARPDKGYSLTDCIAMLVMKDLGLQEVLTHDDHFAQEGFIVLL